MARRNAENQRRTLEVTQQRLDAGRGTAFDTERARTQLGRERHLHVPQILGGGAHQRAPRLHVPPHPSEQVQLPRRVESAVPEILVREAAAPDRKGRARESLAGVAAADRGSGPGRSPPPNAPPVRRAPGPRRPARRDWRAPARPSAGRASCRPARASMTPDPPCRARSGADGTIGGTVSVVPAAGGGGTGAMEVVSRADSEVRRHGHAGRTVAGRGGARGQEEAHQGRKIPRATHGFPRAYGARPARWQPCADAARAGAG